MLKIRQIIFNILFYGFSTAICISYTLLLPLPRRYFMSAIRWYLEISYRIEKYVLGLDYEVRGFEHVPKSGAYIVGGKHQSMYETYKLYHLFFDPAIILKKELLKVPFWGWHAWKAGLIYVERGGRSAAIKSITQGALRVKAEGRPIVIFPQGTRVHPHETSAEKPYKAGIGRIYEATQLPVIPMALNSGVLWPKNAFWKKQGRVIFEFLPPIPPGKPASEMLAELEQGVEEASARLVKEAESKAV